MYALPFRQCIDSPANGFFESNILDGAATIETFPKYPLVSPMTAANVTDQASDVISALALGDRVVIIVGMKLSRKMAHSTNLPFDQLQ